MIEKQSPPKTPEPVLWIVGDWKQAEFSEAVAWLKSAARCLLFDEAASGLSSLHADHELRVPKAIVLAQSRPGQITRSEVERLHAAAPLARLVALVGAWCEGELRSGQPWPGVVRVPAHSWSQRLEQELDLDGGNGPALPRTATFTERIEATLIQVGQDWARGVRACVFSNRRASYEAIVDLLRQLGLETVGQDEAAAADVIVFDGWEELASNGTEPSNGRDGKRPLRVLVLHFPRAEDFERAKQQGIDAALELPLLLSDLATVLGKMTRTAGSLACASG